MLLEIQNVFNGSAPEAVNALVIITHHADVFLTACQQRGQKILHMVGVLILVHHHIVEFSLIVTAHILVLLKKLYRHINNIIKI